eukprot:TRINITY_DN5669_c0_g2_i1.p1 TRINITY_DN5669_c0_g2~~TRINITY_DN5669_c0_g2_i1.p1  ORF type:complete len:299 (-),score=69.81 TRINITY_DN5669_c0_g2_i1:185-1081(-)
MQREILVIDDDAVEDDPEFEHAVAKMMDEVEKRHRSDQIRSDELLAASLQAETGYDTTPQSTLGTFGQEISYFRSTLVQQALPFSGRKPCYSGPLLYSLCNTPADVVCIRSQQQRGLSCGYWSVFNARALHELFRERFVVTEAAIAQRARTHLRLITNTKSLWTEEVQAVAHQLHVPVNLLGLVPRYGVVPLAATVTARAGTKAPQSQTQMTSFLAQHAPQILQQWREDFNRQYDAGQTAHLMFVCNVGQKRVAHWLLLALVREQGQKAKLLVMDSLNGKLSSDTQLHVSYLTAHFMQ